ncbi:allergen Asp f 4 [Sporothrix schenckii 1099-18]|uniref:Allergen Asp f 4 n=2 Tax=Sporothrix schenckii TaxID=29908 RepID=U7PHU9_SPOS1|nr:allergen Asp f 4 [Sporothrix schenckii 1099-18]ERS95163.1 hypothetical protein HMPREF1624_08374 [Sporothrix schenckii ATCC 58251]KJR89952.1 allergen Asp f 4 [Sporothrix schenckii 1099-18]
MRFTNALLLAAIGVSAHPSGHAHLHRAVHEQHQAEKRDVLVTATIDGKVVSWTQGGSPFKAAHKPTDAAAVVNTPTTTSTPAAAATPSTKASSSAKAAASPSAAASPASSAAPSSSDSSSGASGSGISTYEAFGSCASSKARKTKKRATEANIAYAGNTGCNGYGSNVKLVQSSIADKYTYIVKAVNSASSTMQCQVWNKIGPDGGVNGFFINNQALTFTIPAGASQHVVFDANSQGGMCCQEGSVSLTDAGEFLCPWLEFDFGDAANQGWSGFDASALVAGSAKAPFGALNVCTADGATCSTLFAGGGGTNAYLPGDEKLDGIGGNLAPGAVSLIATW